MTDLLNAVLKEIDLVGSRMTIRHLFYRLATAKVIAKDEGTYKNLCAHLSRFRKVGLIPFSAFVDSTRWYYGNAGFNSMEDALADCARSYRKNYWRYSGVHLEVWTEKETIASLLTNAASPYGVQVFVCRGFASLSSLFDAAESFRAHTDVGNSVHLLYFGDHDPSGVLVDQNVARAMSETFNVKVDVRRIAITREQIARFDLPTRPTKTRSTHARGFAGESVEIDAMDPKDLKELVRSSIEQFIDFNALQSMKTAEESERNHLFSLAHIGGSHE